MFFNVGVGLINSSAIRDAALFVAGSWLPEWNWHRWRDRDYVLLSMTLCDLKARVMFSGYDREG